MKLIKLTNLLVLTLALTCLFTGCRKRPTNLTNLPGRTTRPPGDDFNTNPLGQTPPVTDNPSGISLPPEGRHAGWIENREALKAETVYFDFDSSVVKDNQKSKIQAVADYLRKEHADVRVEGNCDERGTEEYNRSLGEHRALAIREALVALGIEPSRVETKSWGEDNPDNAPGHDESAWSKNRRGEFIVLTPPK